MRKNRYFPFGYTMENGIVKPHKTEFDILKDIYELYLAGNSYLKIAEQMSGGQVPYHSTSTAWNKNMVKRILENQAYLGGKYPALIDSATFHAVQEVITGKSPKCRKKHLRSHKTEFVCGECGKELLSGIKENEFYCKNSVCIAHKKQITVDSILAYLNNTEKKDIKYTELKIRQKAELSQLEPSEDILLELCEKLAAFRFSQAQTEPPSEPSEKDWNAEKLRTTKRIIVFNKHIQIVEERK